MCTGKCSKVVAISLYVLALVSVICNIILFFPDFKSEFVSEDGKDGQPRITPEVKYMGGLIGGGVMILIPAIHIHLTSTKGCCNNRCGVSVRTDTRSTASCSRRRAVGSVSHGEDIQEPPDLLDSLWTDSSCSPRRCSCPSGLQLWACSAPYTVWRYLLWVLLTVQYASGAIQIISCHSGEPLLRTAPVDT
uniref:Zgc:172079 n=1 Tax=Oryzias latipes TaxID=8090 RepID=A0A3P9MBT5_ORYLA